MASYSATTRPIALQTPADGPDRQAIRGVARPRRKFSKPYRFLADFKAEMPRCMAGFGLAIHSGPQKTDQNGHEAGTAFILPSYLAP